LGTNGGVKQAEVVQPNAREWIPLLDAIRGLAVLGVVMTHAYHASRISNIYDKSGLLPLGSILGAGSSVRVPLLFWLSGFLMSLVSLTYIGKSTTFDLFIRRRLIRILPTWWTALGLVYASSIMTSIMNNQPLPAWSIAKLLTNLTITSFLFNEVA
jgi:peptidoglycan/LPS O-acetylase OafA/YrhL